MPPETRSSHPNTNPEPKTPSDFSAFACRNREDVSSSNGATARTGAEAQGRSRPRLVKLRRQVGAQQVRSNSRNLPSEAALGFNPFRSVSASCDDTRRLLDASARVISGPSTSVGLDFSNIDVKVEKNTAFVFSAKHDDSAVNLNSGESDINVGFMFGAKRDDIKFDSSSEKDLSCNNGGESLFNDKEKVAIESEGDHGRFGTDTNLAGKESTKSSVKSSFAGDYQNGLASNSNSEMGKASASLEKPISNGADKFETVIGVPNAETSGYNESSENIKQSGFNHRGKGVAGSSDGAFVFESSSSKNSIFHGNDGKKLPVDVDKLNSGKMKDSNLGSAAYKANSFAFESSGNGAGASSMNPQFTLPDEMKKLDINSSGNVDDSKKTEVSSMSSFKHDGANFLFGSVQNATCSSHDPERPTGAPVQGSKGDTLKTNYQYSFMFESTYVANTSSRVSTTKPHSFQARPGENSDLGRCPQGHVNLSFNHQNIQTNCSPSKEIPIGGVGTENVSCFTNGPDHLGEPSTEFKTPMWDPSCFKANMFPEASKKLEFSAKSRSIKDKRVKKKKGKLRQPSVAEHSGRQNHVHHESGSEENSAGCYSPMDFSPYQEATAADQCANQAPITSNETFNIDMNCGPSASDTAAAAKVRNENLATSRENLDDNISDQNCKERQGESFSYHHEQWFAAAPHNGRTISGTETTSTQPTMGEFCSTTGVNSTLATDLDGSCTYAKGQESDVLKMFTFASGFENLDDKKFSFCASSSVKSGSPATKRRQKKKKNPKKVGCDSFVITPSSNVKLGSSSLQFSTQADGTLHFDTSQSQQGNVYASQDKGDNKCEVNEYIKKGSVSSNTTIQELCEKWRLRGNQAYKNGHLPKAEEYYTQGVNSVPVNERSGGCLKPLVLCYSNRAATRMSLGRIREALGDCTVAAALDPNFLKVQMRAANCHLLLGEVDNALQCFNKCVESGGHVCLDRRLMVEASDGLQKAQKVAKGTKSSAKLLEQRTPDAALSALEIIAESLLISSHSEELLKMKAEALSVLRRNEEVIQLCEQTISFAERSFSPAGTHSQSANVNGSTCERSSLMKLWRWFLISKSYFYMGRLETALEKLEKLELSGYISDKCNILESSMSLGVTLRELLRHKNDGNEAFRSGRYLEAIEHYTVALSSNIESRPFAAVCFCNRAAAHQALEQIADAIADCSLSLSLDANYAKAVSRRATLHEMIRDYGQAASDLQRLVSILENESDEKLKSPGTGSRSSGDAKELRQAHRRMSLMEEEAKKGTPLNLYLILGIKQSDSASDIKKAYRKAALRHHPDKAGQFLVKSESGDEGQLWKEIAQKVYKDADKLFKMIGEAYAVLSDPSKRSEYDLEEELRNLRKRGKGSSTSTNKKASEAYSKYPFERRRNWQETWKTYGSSYSRW